MNGSNFGLQPAILVLKEGTDTSQGKGQLMTNMNACISLSEIVQTTLGPRGMDKLIITNGTPTVSNDGATIMGLLDVVQPAARCLVDIAKSQDSEVGDGTTSVVVTAGSLLREVLPLIEAGVHPRLVIRGFNKAVRLCVDRIRSVQLPFIRDSVAQRTRLEKLAGTAMNSKLISTTKGLFSRMVVDAVQALADENNNVDMSMLGIKQVLGGALQDTQLVIGVAFKKTFTYAGFEQLRKEIKNPRVLILNIELEWQAEKDNAEIRLDDPLKFKEIVDAEYRIIYDKLDRIYKSGATVVLSKGSIGDLATQYFADHGIFGAGRVSEDDLARVARCTHAKPVTAVGDINEEALGSCELFEERQVGAERFNFFVGFGKESKAVTFILRGGAEQFIQESERSLHDAIMVVRRAIANPEVVAGAGSIEMQLSAYLMRHAKTIPGKQQLILEAYARALEAIPRNIAENAGFDSTDILNHLRASHSLAIRNNTVCWSGVDINNDNTICDAMEKDIIEPSLIRINALRAATEAACVVLSVDQTINLPSETQNINESKSKTVEMKDKLQKSGLGGSIGGAPGGPIRKVK